MSKLVKALIVVFLVIVAVNALYIVYGYSIDEKQVTLSISKGEFEYCFRSNENRSGVTCDYIDADMDYEEWLRVDKILEDELMK